MRLKTPQNNSRRAPRELSHEPYTFDRPTLTPHAILTPSPYPTPLTPTQHPARPPRPTPSDPPRASSRHLSTRHPPHQNPNTTNHPTPRHRQSLHQAIAEAATKRPGRTARRTKTPIAAPERSTRSPIPAQKPYQHLQHAVRRARGCEIESERIERSGAEQL